MNINEFKVLLLPNHSHAGKTGMALGIKTDILGRAFVEVKLDNGQRVGVFKADEFKVIEKVSE